MGSPVAPPAPAKRPIAVSAVAILSVSIGLIGIAGGTLLLLSPELLIVGLSVAAVGIGLAYLIGAVGLSAGRAWAWVFVLVVSALSIV